VRAEVNLSVGILGFGAMGMAFAERLKEAGASPLVFDVDEAARERAGQAGLKVAESPADLAQACEVVQIIVRSDDEVLAAALGPLGALEGMPAGGVLLVHSTVLPSTTLAVAGAARARGIGVLDACVTGTPPMVRAGRATFLVGGADDLVDRLRPHLLLIGNQVFHLGPLGAGNVGKLVKNLVTASERLVVYEALLIGEASGLSYTKALEMLRVTSSDHVPVVARWEKVFDSSGSSPLPQAGTNLFDKDIFLVAEMGRVQGLDLPLTFQLESSARSLLEANRNSNRS
jgi:3-hydroxyisobutyrate dehydrogenase